ncbi:MAG: hypothetical protein WAT79_02255 [Saprospiraceae bacterium]
MNKYLFFSFIIFLHGCITETDNCGYTPLLVGARHVLKVPIHAVPNKSSYQIGDTLSIIVSMTDSIYDINTEMTFKIEKFLFKPVLGLYNFNSEGEFLQRGFESHTIFIDSIYKPIYKTIITANTYYVNSRYEFLINIVLQTKGRYVFQMQDVYEIYKSGGNPDRWNSYADTITFDGKCPDWKYKISNMIEGENHLEEFERELVYIDSINYDNFYTTKYKHSWQSPYGSGLFAWEETGTYCFEVK